MQAIILAAGYATRLFPLTKDFPKALLSVGGKPMLDHLVDALNEIDRISAIHVVSNSRFYPHFAAWENKRPNGVKLHVYDDGTAEDATKLGAIGDMEFVRQRAGIDEDCLVVAGDNLLMIDYAAFCAEFERTKDTLLLCQKNGDVQTLRRFAVARADETGEILELEEKPRQPKSDLAVFALYLFPKRVMERLPQYLAQGNSPDSPGHYPVWLLKSGDETLRAYVTKDPCYDIGTHESLKMVREIYGE